MNNAINVTHSSNTDFYTAMQHNLLFVCYYSSGDGDCSKEGVCWYVCAVSPPVIDVYNFQ